MGRRKAAREEVRELAGGERGMVLERVLGVVLKGKGGVMVV